MINTEFDLCAEAKPLRNKLWLCRGTDEFWRILAECDKRVQLRPQATDADIARLRDFVGDSLPGGLEEFLRRSNGLLFDFDPIVLPVDSIISATERIHSYPSTLPSSHLLFFGDFGDGDMFAFAKRKDGEWSPDVLWWEHERDSCYSCAFGIWDYVAAHVSWSKHISP
jgi:hypothetical protein